MILSSHITENIETLNKLLHTDENFDIICREFELIHTKACIYFIDGMAKDDILEKMMTFFYGLKENNFPENATAFSKQLLPYGETDVLDDIHDIIKQLLSGVPILLIDTFDQAICVDFRTYPARSVQEPEKDKVLRGSRDGFVETIVFNTALIRRRIRNPELIISMTNVGKSSYTDIAICYMKNRVSKQLLEKITKKIEHLHIDALTMNGESLAEALLKRHWFNPFPKFKYTERPDTAAASILEGNIIILVDTANYAIILPTTIFEITEEANDYYFPPLTGTYLRLSRLFINFIALFFTPVWLLLMNNPQWIPEWLDFIRINDPIYVPLIFQLLILEFAIDGMKLAAMNTPNMLSMPLSVIAGIVLGDYTVQSGWFNAQTMLYMAFVAIANYSQANIELGYALKFLRLLMLILVAIFDYFGLIAGVIITFLALLFNKTLAGNHFLYPLIPFDFKQLCQRLYRRKL